MISSMMRHYGARACLLLAVVGELAIGLSHLSRAWADSKESPSGKKPPASSSATPASPKPSDPAPVAKQPRPVAHRLTAAEEKILHALAAPTTVQFVDTQLKDALNFLKEQQGIAIQIDEAALTEEAVATDVAVNLNLSNLSLYSVLNLMLKPNKLGFTLEDRVLKITTTQKLLKMGVPAALQQFAVRDGRIQKAHADLKKALNLKTSVDFKNTGLKDALYFLYTERKIPLFLAESEAEAAKIDFNQAVTLKVENVAVSDILNRLLEPSKLKYWIENEVVMIGVQDPDDERLRRIKARKENAAREEKSLQPARKTP